MQPTAAKQNRHEGPCDCDDNLRAVLGWRLGGLDSPVGDTEIYTGSPRRSKTTRRTCANTLSRNMIDRQPSSPASCTPDQEREYDSREMPAKPKKRCRTQAATSPAERAAAPRSLLPAMPPAGQETCGRSANAASTSEASFLSVRPGRYSAPAQTACRDSDTLWQPLTACFCLVHRESTDSRDLAALLDSMPWDLVDWLHSDTLSPVQEAGVGAGSISPLSPRRQLDEGIRPPHSPRHLCRHICGWPT